MATAAAQQQPTVSVTEIIHALEAARDLPEAALRSAVPCAAEIAPAVLELVEKAIVGVHLMPRQANLLFWGIHVLAAGRRTEIYRPLLRLFSQQDRAYVEWLFGDGIDETLASIVISVFDGDPVPLIDRCADARIEGTVRWNLMAALARLTFDGVVPREHTVAFLQRFERDSLAAPRDTAWVGWAEAIQLLGLEEMRELVHATWKDGRNPERTTEQHEWDEALTLACSLAPGDPGLFVQKNITALDDPVAALAWTGASKTAEEAGGNSLPSDPAAIFALTSEETRWLKGFCYSRHVRPGSMFMEAMDRFFCGLIAGPGPVTQNEGLSALWGAQNGPDDPPNPDYDSPEQAEHVRGLLARHWQTISLRLASGHLHKPVLEDALSNLPAEAWALGFLRAITMRPRNWGAMGAQAKIGYIVTGLVALAGRDDLIGTRLPNQARAKIIVTLPDAVRSVHAFFHEAKAAPAAPLARRPVPSDLKIGRNEPCPCGSGKKYKRCCAARQ